MKEYKVESLIYYTKLTLDSEHIVKKSKEEEKLISEFIKAEKEKMLLKHTKKTKSVRTKTTKQKA